MVTVRKTISCGNNGKILTVGRRLAKILTISRKSQHPIETILPEWEHKQFSSKIHFYI